MADNYSSTSTGEVYTLHLRQGEFNHASPPMLMTVGIFLCDCCILFTIKALPREVIHCPIGMNVIYLVMLQSL
jgi:hypothetical protein